ncbi:MAG: hypothetical protein VYC39_11330 [Myxococcota bacterium]|nr:hypothetical protein [Myxococcota bacterium]
MIQESRANPLSKTSSSAATDEGISFPENSGSLNVAATPEGKADTGTRVNIPEGGQPAEWRNKGTPPDELQSAKPTSSQLTKVKVGGYIRIMGQMTENDDLPYVGRNDGFRLGNARIEVSSQYGQNVKTFMSVETAAEQSESPNDPNALFAVEIRDAFIDYEISQMATLRLGRFKAPYELGELESTIRRVFIDAPIESRGVTRTRGIEQEGLSQGRQVGLILGSEKMGLSEEGFDLGYALAITNGRTNFLSFNDNDRPAGFLRMSALYSDILKFNLAGFVDMRTGGELPNQFDQDVMGAEASLQVEFSGLRLEAQGLVQTTQFPTTGIDDVTSLGFHAQWAYQLWQLQVGYRLGYFDPNTRYDFDRVIEHTIALNYTPKIKLPGVSGDDSQSSRLRFGLNGTFSDEQRSINNNRVEFLTGYIF